jgi:hypothetical protein
MPDRQAPPPPRLGAALFRGEGLDWSLALMAVAIGVLLYLLDDRTNWSGGFGFDGRFYGELARNFPSAVFGHGAVIPPGLGHYEGPSLTGIDSYYAYRLVPSGLAWLSLQALDLSPTNGHVVGVFAGLDALMFGLATFCWCRSADLLGLGDRAKIVGAIGLIVNFSVFRTGGYYPVSTDQVALGLGALSLYLWLRGATVPLIACIVAACFTWPLHLAIGPLLLLFPPPAGAAGSLAAGAAERRPANWRPPRFGVVIGAMTAILAVASLTAIQLGNQVSSTGTPQLPVFPLSAAVVGVYVFAVVAFLLPSGGWKELVAIVRSIRIPRLLLAIGVLAGVLIAAAAIARRPGFDTGGLLEEGFWSSSLDPGLFIVLFVGYYGLLVLALLVDLPRAAADSWRLGPAMVAIVGGALLAALLTQPREISDAYAFLVLPGVLAFRRLFGFSNTAILAFLGLSILLSRIWLPIGNLSTDLGKLTEFPAQAYYMAAGPWTAPSMYAVQLAGVVAIGGAMWLLTRRRRSGEIAD